MGFFLKIWVYEVNLFGKMLQLEENRMLSEVVVILIVFSILVAMVQSQKGRETESKGDRMMGNQEA